LVHHISVSSHDHSQKTAILKGVDSFKYLGVPIDKDLSMSTLHAQILDIIQKANGKLQGLLRDLKSNRELHSSHHSTLGRGVSTSLAAARGDTTAGLGYITYGAEVNTYDDDSWTPLAQAARNGHTETVIILAQHGADVNVVNTFCESPLWLAARSGKTDTVLALAKFGAKIIENPTGCPVYIAAKFDHLETVRMLVKNYNANPKTPDYYDHTTLFYVASYGRVNMVRLLVEECGLNPHATNSKGCTLVYVAAEKGMMDTVRFSVKEYGVNPNRPNYEGNTPVSIASKQGKTDTVLILCAP
jgi:ankyrin repeat protein